MGRILAHDIPIFAGFRNLMQENRPGNKTLFTVIDENKIQHVTQTIEQICGSLNEPGTGIIVTIPIGIVKGIS